MRRSGVAAALIAMVVVAVVLVPALGYVYLVESSQVSSLNQTISSQSSAISSEASALSAQSTSIASQSQSMSQDAAQIASLDAQITILNQNISSLSTQKESLQSQVTTDQAKVNSDNANITSLQAQNVALQNQLTEADANVTALQSKISSLSATIQNMNTTITTLNTTISMLNGQITSLTSQEVSLNAQVSQDEIQLAGLTAITTLADSDVEVTSQSFSIPAASTTLLGQVSVINFTAQYSGYVDIELSAASNSTYTGPVVLNVYATTVKSPTYTGIYEGPFNELPVPGTIAIPVVAGTVSVSLVNAVEAGESATITVTYYW